MQRCFSLNKFTYLLQSVSQRATLGQFGVCRRFSRLTTGVWIDNTSLRTHHPLTWCTVRTYASKMKGGSKMKTKHVDPRDYEEIIDLDKMKSKMQEKLDHLKSEYIHNLNTRTKISAFDHIQVPTTDGKFPVNQLGQIIMKSPQLVLINMSASPQHLEDVVEALKKSGITMVPLQIEGTTIAVTLSKITRERREELAKGAKKLFQNTKNELNDVYLKESRVINKHKSLSLELKKNIDAMLLTIKNSYVDEAEKLNKIKEKELLGS